MARYIVTSGSKFEPFTYEELAAPIQQFTDAQNAAAEKYDELNMQTQALANYIDKTNDPDAWHLYDTYMTQLQALQNNLWEKGYNAGTVKDISTARGLYARDINRISEAVKARQTQAQKQADMLMKDPSLFVSYKPGEKSLDEYLHNDNYGMDWRSYSGNTLAAEGKAIGATLAERLFSDPKYEVLRETNNAYFQQIMNYGVDAETINRVVGNYLEGTRPTDPVGETVYDMIDQVYKASRMGEWADDNTKRDAVYRIAEGIHSATGKTEVDTLANPYAKPSSGNGGGGGGADATDKDYGTVPIVLNQRNRAGARTQEENESMYGPIEGGERPFSVKDETGTVVGKNIGNALDLTEAAFHPEYVDSVWDKYRIDPRDRRGHINQARQNGRVIRTNKNGDIVETELRTFAMTKNEAEKLGIENVPDRPIDVRYYDSNSKRWVTDKKATIEVNSARYRYQQDLKQFKEDNDVNNKYLRKNAMTPREERKIRSNRNVSPDVNWRSLMYTQNPGAINQQSESIQIVSPTESNDKLGDTFQRIIQSEYAEHGGDRQGNQSQFIFYKVGGDGISIDKKGVTDIKKVFPVDSNGNVKRADDITLSIRPYDMEEGWVRFNIGGKQWAIRLEMLGADVAHAFNDMMPIESTDGENIGVYSTRQLLAIAAMPIFEPTQVINWPDSQMLENTELVMAALGEYYPNKETKDDEGNVISREAYTLREIAKDGKLKAELQEAIRSVMAFVISKPVDYLRNFPMRYPGNTAEGSYYNGR